MATTQGDVKAGKGLERFEDKLKAVKKALFSLMVDVAMVPELTPKGRAVVEARLYVAHDVVAATGSILSCAKRPGTGWDDLLQQPPADTMEVWEEEPDAPDSDDPSFQGQLHPEGRL